MGAYAHAHQVPDAIQREWVRIYKGDVEMIEVTDKHIEKLVDGKQVIYVTGYSNYQEKNGRAALIVAVYNSCNPRPDIDPEVFPMYLIEFNDQERILAWPEELMPL